MESSAKDKLLESIQNDLKNISLETKKSKSFQLVRESTDEAVARLRASSGSDPNMFLVANQILYPLLQGCETKDSKVVRMCLGLMQRLIVNKVLDFKGAGYITDTLWMLMESGIEEVKIVQTLTLLLTSSHVVQNETLAKCLVICFRLNFTRDLTVNTIAGATIRQLVPVVFERVAIADPDAPPCNLCWLHAYEEPSPKLANLIRGIFPKDTNPLVINAYLMLQDIVLLVGADQPVWMTGIVEMTRTFGLELLESMLKQFPSVFNQHPQFKMLLKERVCSLVIKLFSPNIKYKLTNAGSVPGGQAGSGPSGQGGEKPSYAITAKLLRVVGILILEYHEMLTTESEIFLSLIMKFLDPDKPPWQNGGALEIFHKILVRPHLLTFICSKFDMNDHSTNVFRDIINTLGAFVQNVMLAGPATPMDPNDPNFVSGQGSQGANAAGATPYGPGSSPQPGFSLRNVWKPLTISFIGGQTKEIYLDVSDRGEIPAVSDGYCLSLAYVCMLDTVRSMALLIDHPDQAPAPDSAKSAKSPESPIRKPDISKECIEKLLESSWCGLLSALSLLLDASTDDSSTENILKTLQTFASFCGKMKLNGPRDAYLAAICKASLPPHYTLNVLKATPSTQNVSGPSGKSQDPAAAAASGETDIRHQVVAVGTPLPTASLPTSAHQGPVMLTAKNLQCMRAILSVAHCHGNLLGASWHIILTTLQHLVWILGLKPVTGGALTTSNNTSTENSTMITTAVMADLPVLSNMVTRLFESSCDLSDASVKHLIEALCNLSEESMELASSNREPSLFAVAKLLETALVNLGRVDIVWRPITSHLLVVCQHPHLRMRQWGCEAVTFLSKQALQHRNYDPPLKENNRLQTLLLSPLAELSAIPYPDVRQKQLDTILHVLHSSGETLSHGWPLVLTMIGSLDSEHSDILIRSAFQCLQLVFTDFLPTIPYRCYPLCVETATKFGSQKAELNVSLTAIGLLWNLSDYFYQNVSNIGKNSESGKLDDAKQIFPECFLTFPGSKNISSFDKLWMCLYCKLKDLCLDSRPSVRKSSGQTLFSTIAAHGSILEANTWQAVLWQVLFPLLDNVIIQSDNASSEKVSQSNVIMIHHSRNTAQKQWAETKVLTISGVVRVFNTKRNLLKSIGDYSKAWVLLLEYVEKMALSNTSEVSLAALKALQELITSSSNQPPKDLPANKSELQDINWTLCWKAWQNIGNQKANYIANTSEVVTHSQVLLTGFVQIFPALFPHIKASFRREDVENLGKVLLSCALVPLDTEFDSVNSITPLHAAAIEGLELVKNVALNDNNNLLPELFEVMFKFANASLTLRPNHKDTRFKEKFSLFGEACLENIALTYEASKDKDCVLSNNILFKIVRVLHVPLRQKYRCYSQTNWKIAVNVLIKVLRCGIPVARACKDSQRFQDFWAELGDVFDKFLFPQSTEEQKQEDRIADEAVDCHIIELLREEVLPFPNLIPMDFIKKIVVMLNKGSIHSTMTLSDDCSGTIGLREDFAKLCFETLLEFSLLESADIAADASQGSITNRLAISSLLQRFKEVLVDAIDGEKLNRNIPLQRQKTAEISFVLKAIGTVISSMKKASRNNSNKATWSQIIGLYPYLVQFTETSSPQISASVKDALLEYHDLLQPFDGGPGR